MHHNVSQMLSLVVGVILAVMVVVVVLKQADSSLVVASPLTALS